MAEKSTLLSVPAKLPKPSTLPSALVGNTSPGRVNEIELKP